MRSLSQQACSASLHVTDWDQFESHIEEEEQILEKAKKQRPSHIEDRKWP